MDKFFFAGICTGLFIIILAIMELVGIYTDLSYDTNLLYYEDCRHLTKPYVDVRINECQEYMLVHPNATNVEVLNAFGLHDIQLRP